MSEDGSGSRDPLGSVHEEAAKLVDALHDWAGASADEGVDGLVDGLGERWRSVNEHIATGGADCTYCPVCQVVHKVREASPEVRTHLAVAASSLLQAAATLLEARAPRPSSGESPVTRIDLDDDGSTSGG